MAEVILSQAGTANQNMRLKVTYTAGSGSITITGLAGCRTDGYEVSAFGNATWVYCNIAGTSYTLTPSYGGLQKIMFASNSNYATFWSGSQSKSGMTGNQTVEFTFTCNDHNSNIVNSKFTATIDAGSPITYPTLSGISVSNVGRTSLNYSFTVTNNGGAAIVSSGGFSSVNSNMSPWASSNSGTSNSIGGLTPNTNYYVQGYAGNGTYTSYTNIAGPYKTTGNAPSITSVTTTPTVTSCSFTINVSYDTNDGFSSRTIQYGTTTSYGSSTTGTSISGLSPSTTYYYKVTINSVQGRSGTYTGSFTTLASKAVKLSVNGGAFTDRNLYISVNGGTFKLIPKNKIKKL